MAELAGHGGDMKYDASSSASASTVLAGINNWTVSYTGAALETTDFANVGVKTYVAGPTGWTGTAAGYYDSTVSHSSIAPGDTVSLRFEMKSAKSMKGIGIVTGVSFTTGIDGAVTTNFDFQGTASLTIT